MGASGGTRFLGFAGHLSTRTSATAGQDGIRTACARRRVLLVDELVDSCPSDLDYILRAPSVARLSLKRATCSHRLAHMTQCNVRKDGGAMRAAHFGLGGLRPRGDVYRWERLSPESVLCRCRKIEICMTGDGSAPICKGASVLSLELTRSPPAEHKRRVGGPSPGLARATTWLRLALPRELGSRPKSNSKSYTMTCLGIFVGLGGI